MKDVLIWVAVLSLGVAAIAALVPLIPFLLGIAGVIVIWRLIAYIIAGK